MATNEKLMELYERNDQIEKELNKLNHDLKSADDSRKEELLQELQQVIDGIELLEGVLGARNIYQILDEVMSHEQMEKAVWQAVNANGGVILEEK